MATVEMTGRTVNITPKPRILKVLSRIEFDPWQCIAELVDNSFDEFIEIKRSGIPWNEPYEVSVSLPTSMSADAAVVISDNGRGMSIDRVKDAVSAGFSGNDPMSKLGLFGMGFNVATARIGSVTRFLTSQAGDADWIGVEIDLDKIKEGFEAPEIRRSKDSPNHHGTIVEISRLENFSTWFTRPGNPRRLRLTLGGIYSYLLDTEGFRLTVNDIGVKPYRHCVWNKSRTVTRDGEVIPAVIEIDEDLGDRAVCLACGRWQDPANAECEECDSVDLEVRPRRIWGWLGIQRYLDSKEFGIDFLRNGRKIMRLDRSLFQWRHPDDPNTQGDVEYPIEVPNNMGRIVGEIHLDHVAVNYTKDSFDSGDRGWRYAVERVRGNGPLLPKTAAALGYERNDSPLGKLHRGYRRNDPGANYLTPGNGKVRFDNRDWDRKFREDDPEYQDDAKWWGAIAEHDRLAAEAKERKHATEQAAFNTANVDVTEEFRAPEEGSRYPEAVAETGEGSGDAIAETPRPETEIERAERLMSVGRPIPELHGDFTVAGVPGRPVKMTAWRVRERLAYSDAKRVPVLMIGGRGGILNAFVDVDHPHFHIFADDPADVVLIELAQHMLVRAPGGTTISAVYADLKERYLPTHAIDAGRLIGEASQVLRDLQERMVECVAENPARPWANALNDAERHMTTDRITEVLRTADIDAVLEAGTYLPLVPPQVVPRIVEEWPEAFLDNRLFTAPYQDVSSPSARRQTVAVITAYLLDVAWLASAPPSPSKEQLIRSTLSLRLIPENLAE
jgi:hypothetical protein